MIFGRRDRGRGGRRRSLRSQRGFALPVTLMALAIGFGLASVGSVAAISSIRNAGRDNDTQRALAAAEAGIEQALLRQNQIFTADGYPCLVSGSGGDLIPGSPRPNGWCPEHTGTVDDGAFTYTVKPAEQYGPIPGQVRMVIVSEGVYNEATRKISVSSIASTGAPAFAPALVVGLDDFSSTGNGRIDATAATNGNMTLGGNSVVCGDVGHGIGKTLTVGPNASVCPGRNVIEQQYALAPPDPGNVAEENDNGRFFSLDTRSGAVTWNASSRTLSLSGKGTLTLGGANYSLCKLDMSGQSNIYIAAGATVRVWFDSPENCGFANNVVQMSMTGNSEISTTSGQAFDAGFLFVGSDTVNTRIVLAGNGTSNEMMIYAPRTDVEISGNGDYLGAIASKRMNNVGNGTITGDQSALAFEVGVQTNYTPERFVECVGPLSSTPDQGC